MVAIRNMNRYPVTTLLIPFGLLVAVVVVLSLPMYVPFSPP
jgi:hypothetical protein